MILKDGRRNGKGETTTDGDGGGYAVDDTMVVMTSLDEGTLRSTFTVDGPGNLHLTPVPPMDKDAQFVFATYPSAKIG